MNHMNVEEVEEVEEEKEEKEESIAQRVKARSDRRTLVVRRVEEVLGRVIRFLNENPLFIGHTVQVTRHEILSNGYFFDLSLNKDTYVRLFIRYESGKREKKPMPSLHLSLMYIPPWGKGRASFCFIWPWRLRSPPVRLKSDWITTPMNRFGRYRGFINCSPLIYESIIYGFSPRRTNGK